MRPQALGDKPCHARVCFKKALQTVPGSRVNVPVHVSAVLRETPFSAEASAEASPRGGAPSAGARGQAKGFPVATVANSKCHAGQPRPPRRPVGAACVKSLHRWLVPRPLEVSTRGFSVRRPSRDRAHVTATGGGLGPGLSARRTEPRGKERNLESETLSLSLSPALCVPSSFTDSHPRGA